MKKNIILFGLVSLVLFDNLSAVDKADTAKTKNTKVSIPLPKPKKLKSKELELLDAVFEMQPQGTLRARLASNAVLQALKAIYSKNVENESVFVKTQVKNILDPIRKFFESIREYHNLVIPIVEESLGIKRDKCSSILINFFTTKQEINLFFDSEIKTVPELEKACLEFLTVFGDLNFSLSESTLKVCDKLIAELKSQQTGQKK